MPIILRSCACACVFTKRAFPPPANVPVAVPRWSSKERFVRFFFYVFTRSLFASVNVVVVVVVRENVRRVIGRTTYDGDRVGQLIDVDTDRTAEA